jgi:tRNA nucleotidyltransferase (CCA-adding enzyme)
MEYTKIDSHIQSKLTFYLKDYNLEKIIAALDVSGGTILLVGGAVRDLLLKLPLKDLDIEVHHLEIAELQKILSQFGTVNNVGKAYGVLRINGIDVDWSLPRTDAHGRKPEVVVDPNMSFAQAFRRRDLTINAMGINVVTSELIDPFGGLYDLENKTLRAPDLEKFVEDPLRFYRVMQFVARFEFKPDADLNLVCSRMNISEVSRERIEQEFKKALLLSHSPSLGFRWLHEIGRLQEILPELAVLQNIEQSPQWHPEGDVFEHTMQAVDAAARQKYDLQHTKLIIMYAALCHDLGKAQATKVNEDGRIISHGHEILSADLAKKMLHRITNNHELIDAVIKLVRYHMQPGALVDQDAQPSAYKRLAYKLWPEATLNMLAQLAQADRQGRNPEKKGPLTQPDSTIEEFVKRSQQALVLHEIEQPILQGRDLLDVVEAGPELGKLVKEAYTIQIQEGIKNKDELKRRVLKNLS